MIQLSNLTAQTLAPGQAITFDKVVLYTGCGECFNSLIPTSVKLKSHCSIYDVDFHGNITSATAGTTVQIAIAVAGTAIPYTAMDATLAAAGDLANVGSATYIRDCCSDADRVSVINTGTAPVTIAPNSSFRIARRS